VDAIYQLTKFYIYQHRKDVGMVVLLDQFSMNYL